MVKQHTVGFNEREFQAYINLNSSQSWAQYVKNAFHEAIKRDTKGREE